MKKNHLVVIGPLSGQVAYLNISREEATKRYLADRPEDKESVANDESFVYEFDFYDSFETYEIYPNEGYT